MLTLLRCAGCGSGFYDPPGVAEFSDFLQERDDFWRFYVEVGGGVWETIWPVLADIAAGPRTVLDVGCGFGFLVDFWRRQTGGEAIGVELADYGQIGARMMGIPVHQELLQDCAALTGRRFDVVYASEVIEHVPDPRAFVSLLARFVADDGVLVMTTPNLDFVAPANLSPTLLAALAPGFHGFLMSSRAFEDAAREAGFAHVEVRTFGERQMLWAARSPRRIDCNPDRMRPPYFAYLDRALLDHDPASPLWQGYAYRLVRDLVNLGRAGEASARADALAAALARSYGPDVLDPVAIVPKLRGCTTLAEFGAIAPYFLPNFYFSLAGIALQHKRDRERARQLYRAAGELAVSCGCLDPTSFLEAISLVWPARIQDASIALAQGHTADAAQGFARLARDGLRCDPADGYARADPALIEATVPGGCLELARAQAWGPARLAFSAYCTYLASRYPHGDLTTRACVDEALASGAGSEWPADPAFAFFFQGIMDAAAPLQGEPNYERLEALRELAATLDPRSAWGVRVAGMAQAALQYLPRRQTVTSFQFTYRLGPTSPPKR